MFYLCAPQRNMAQRIHRQCGLGGDWDATAPVLLDEPAPVGFVARVTSSMTGETLDAEAGAELTVSFMMPPG